MQNATAIIIGIEQIKYLEVQADLGLMEGTIRQVLEFKMPTFEEVKEYQKEHNDDWNEMYLKRAYHYYEGHTMRLQRRLIRYMAIFLAMDGQLNLKEYPQVKKDLEEIDIDIVNQESVQDGRRRVNRAFSYAMETFLKYAKEATCLSNYNLILTEEWTMCCSNDERFGNERLRHCDIWLDVKMSHPGMYVELTHKQERALEETYENKMKDTMDELGKAFSTL